MSRTLLDLDDDALGRAAKVLGTTTKVDTVNTALRAIAAEGSAGDVQHFDGLLDLVGDRLAETDVRADAWR